MLDEVSSHQNGYMDSLPALFPVCLFKNDHILVVL